MKVLELKNVFRINQTTNENYVSYYTKINVKDLIKISETLRLSDSRKGIQRHLDLNRVNNIALYCEREDAIFPTPIVLTLNKDFVTNDLERDSFIKLDLNMIDLLGKPFSIIDGQHRIEGIKKYIERNYESKDFELPIIIFMDADLTMSANIFVTINSNQKPVDKSIIYELFGIMYENNEVYTVESFANRVVKILNETKSSPFNNSIRILGRKTNSKQFISQGTVAKKIVERVSSPQNIIIDNNNIKKGLEIEEDQRRIYRHYFANNRPEIVAKIMINFFKAFSEVFDEFWKNTYITKKAVGFSGLMKLLDTIYKNEKNLKYENFLEIFSEMKAEHYEDIEKTLLISGSSESVANSIGNKLSDIYLTTSKSTKN